MLFVDSESGGSSSGDRIDAMRQVAKFYGSEDSEPELYQRYLREARRAYSIGNRKAEFKAYQRVLDLLNAEDVLRSHNGLTGDRKDDKKLRTHIGILLNR